VFDIHGGGVDLVFPHHENEIAQSCCAFGSTRMANVWMHNGFLQVESEKMSKSLGNFVTIRELLETGKFGNRTWPGEALRLAMLRTHYRDPIDWTVRELERAEQELAEWYRLIQGEPSSAGTIDEGVVHALSDDLNTHAAIVRLQELAKAGDGRCLRASLSFLGFSSDLAKLSRRVFAIGRADGTASVTGFSDVTVPVQGAAADASVGDVAVQINFESDGTYSTDESTQRLIDDLTKRRKAARAAKDFAAADKIRDDLAALGFAIRDNKDGTTTVEPKR
jgi:cysteinyl-tRNA synthetase